MSIFSSPHFHDEDSAYAYVEARIWPNGPICRHCGGVRRISKKQGKSTRIGTYKCYQCRKPFTVKIGSIFEGSKVAMRLWLQAMYLIAGSKKGISSNQLHRILGVTLKTAWFLSRRIREAMHSNNRTPFGGNGGDVAVDETFIGQHKCVPKRRAFHHKVKVLALIDRDTRQARTLDIDDVNAKTLMPLVMQNVVREPRVMTDEHRGYRDVCKFFSAYGTTSHGRGEYVNLEDRSIHSNTVEGYFRIFKRGMNGVYPHCGEQHLHRYLAEYEFRDNKRSGVGIEDAERSDRLLMGVIGKGLTYQTASAKA